MDEIILRGIFHRFAQSISRFSTKLTRSHLIWTDDVNPPADEATHSVLIQDILNVNVLESQDNTSSTTGIEIVCYIKDEEDNKRARRSFEFHVNNGTNVQNTMIAYTWRRTIRWLMHEPSIDIRSLKAKETDPPNRKFLVLISPMSGKGQSRTFFDVEVEPMMKDANVAYDVITTAYHNHAYEIAKLIDLTSYTGIMYISGDGLGKQIVSGFMHRPDWKKAITTPIAPIPAGSGNGVCASLLAEAGESCNVVSATFAALRGEPTPLSVYMVQTGNDTHYGITSFSSGTLSEIGIKTEHLRFLGKVRYEIAMIWRVLFPRMYRATISYLEYVDESTRNMDCNTSTQFCFPYDESIINRDYVDVEREATDLSNSVASCSDNKQSKDAVPNGSMTSIQESVPWRILSGQFSVVFTYLVPYVLETHKFQYDLQTCSDYMWLCFNNEPQTHVKGLRIFLAYARNETPIPYFTYVKVKAFRLKFHEPCPVTVDGEGIEVKDGVLEVRLHKGLGRAFSMKPSLSAPFCED